ncbi:MAG: tail fiber domain-containing protein [Lachnospiraceae bacterium]|nr:tail fiber domain-containing protein [Lachnospiraceae bacterium]
MANISHFTQTVNGVSTTYDIHDAGAVPRSGGAVITGSSLGRTDNTSWLIMYGGMDSLGGARIIMQGKDSTETYNRGSISLECYADSILKTMRMFPSGTWTWEGTAVQLVSDARLKQQITEIDDKLLDAWEDVELAQFKYNDAVDQKGKDKARLHTGYVVQQIDSACKSHGVDVSAYGLYCHEEYPQETEEVEVEQADGTKVKERKVIREASEHYSLRYTEVYAVECMYLRRCIARLTARIEQLTTRIEQLEKEQEAGK